MVKERKRKGLDCGARADATAGNVRMVAADLKLTTVPADVRTDTIETARTSAERPVQQIQVKSAGAPPDEETEQETLEQSYVLSATLGELVG